MNDRLRKMFEQVKDESFDKWEQVDTISEQELLNHAHNPQSNTPQQPQPQPQQGAQQVQQQYTTTTTTTVQQGGTMNLANLIDEETATEFMDIAGSSLSVIAVKIATKQKVRRSVFTATEKEKDTLKPLMKTALAQTNIKITNPFEALFWGFVMVYGSKVGVTIAENYLDKEDSPKQAIVNPDGTPRTGRGRPRKNQL